MRKVIASIAAAVLVALALVLGAASAHACGYWDCTDYDGVTACYWY